MIVTHFEGTPQRTYPIKNTTSAIEYLLESKPRSVCIPAISALPMLDGLSAWRARLNRYSILVLW